MHRVPSPLSPTSPSALKLVVSVVAPTMAEHLLWDFRARHLPLGQVLGAKVLSPVGAGGMDADIQASAHAKLGGGVEPALFGFGA